VSYRVVTDSFAMGPGLTGLLSFKNCRSTHFEGFQAAKPTRLVDPAIPIKYFQ